MSCKKFGTKGKTFQHRLAAFVAASTMKNQFVTDWQTVYYEQVSNGITLHMTRLFANAYLLFLLPPGNGIMWLLFIT